MESFLANRPKGTEFSRPIRSSTSGVRNDALRPFGAAPAARETAVPAQGDGGVSPEPTGDGSCAPGRVDVERDDDGVVRRIVVHCGCGQQVPVECEY